MNKNALCRGVKRIAVGYVFLQLHINIGKLDILPGWFLYGYVLEALPVLKKKLPSIELLRPLAWGLLGWSLLDWILPVFGFPLVDLLGYFGPITELIVSVVGIYFHFQLLTDLAQLAAQYHCPCDKSILYARTISTVSRTIVSLPVQWEYFEATQVISVVLIIISALTAFYLWHELFSLRRELWKAISQEEEREAAPV